MGSIRYSVRTFKGWYVGTRKFDVLKKKLDECGFFNYTSDFMKNGFRRAYFMNRDNHSLILAVDLSWPSGVICDITIQ